MGKTAFEAERENVWKLDPDTILIVGFDTKDGKEHPLVDERVLKLRRDGFNRPELVASMMSVGQIQNCVVRKNGDKTECVVGRHRVLAGREVKRLQREAGQEPTFTLKCMQRKDNDVDNITGVVSAENAVRRDDDMLTKARNARRLIDIFGKPKEKVASDMGMTMEVLDNHLRVLELSPKMQAAVERGVITATAAATFVDMAHEEQDAKIAEAEASGLIISVPEARRQKKARTAVKKGKSTKEVATRGKGVAIGVMRKIADDEVFVTTLSDDAKRLLRWVVGEGSHRSVPGLGAALRRSGELNSED